MDKIISTYSLNAVNKYVSFINKNYAEIIDKIIKDIQTLNFHAR